MKLRSGSLFANLLAMLCTTLTCQASTIKFLSTDTKTQGNWKGVYGSEGVDICTSPDTLPSYSKDRINGARYIWTSKPTEIRALQSPIANSTDRLATCWYTYPATTPYTIDVNITDGKSHLLSLYLLDWDKRSRHETIEALDADTNTVVDKQDCSGFNNGVYKTYEVSGHVIFRITNLQTINAVVSGVFLDPDHTGASNRINFGGKDHYILGLDYPWWNYGTDFGTGAWGKYTNFGQISGDFQTFPQYNINVVRWFIFADGRYSPEFENPATNSKVTGLDSQFFSDIDTALQYAYNNHVYIMPCLVDFLMFNSQQSSGGVYGGGHYGILLDPVIQQSYLDNALKPLLQHIAASPYRSAVPFYDICNEIEFDVSGLGAGGNAASIQQMQTFIRNCANYIHTYGGGALATTGCAQDPWVQYEKGCNLDFYEIHWYPSYTGRDLPQYSALGLDKPCIVGEFPTNNGDYGADYTVGSTKQYSAQYFIDTIYNRGYAGALGWAWAQVDNESYWPGFYNVYQDFVKRHSGIY